MWALGDLPCPFAPSLSVPSVGSYPFTEHVPGYFLLHYIVFCGVVAQGVWGFYFVFGVYSRLCTGPSGTFIVST